jgi:HEAT repeat protein
MRLRRLTALGTVALTGIVGGCADGLYRPGSPATLHLKQRALASLTQGVRYRHVPVIRCQAVEALQIAAPAEALSWIRSALHDDNAGVRFAACLALGERKDTASRSRFAELLREPQPSVQVAAIFALHRLGDVSHTNRLPEYLLDQKDPDVRRNAAIVLGRLGEPGAVKLLARVMDDPDEGLRMQAMEAMALLGSKEACQDLTFLANSGLGAREVFAINALGQVGDRELSDLFRYKLKSAAHRETRLAAARALGRLGICDGYRIALENLTFNQPDRNPAIVKDDPPESQIVRVRTMAALALGAIGDAAALPGLADTLRNPYDPRVELAAALAVLQVLHSDTQKVLMTRREPRTPQ